MELIITEFAPTFNYILGMVSGLLGSTLVLSMVSILAKIS